MPHPSRPPPAILSYHRRPPAIHPEAQSLAYRSLRHLGPIYGLLGAGFTGGAVFIMVYDDGPFAPFSWPEFIFAGVSAFFATSGLVCWICSRKLRRGSRPAALAALTLAATHLGLMVVCMMFSAIGAVEGGCAALIPFIISTLFILGLLDLIRNLQRYIRSRDLLRSYSDIPR